MLRTETQTICVPLRVLYDLLYSPINNARKWGA